MVEKSRGAVCHNTWKGLQWDGENIAIFTLWDEVTKLGFSDFSTPQRLKWREKHPYELVSADALNVLIKVL